MKNLFHFLIIDRIFSINREIEQLSCVFSNDWVESGRVQFDDFG